MEKILFNQNVKENAFEASPQLLAVQKLLQLLKDKKLALENPNIYREKCFQAYKDLSGFLLENGGEFVTDVNLIYKKYGNNFASPLIVRREDPEKVAALSEGQVISLAFDPNVVGDRGDKYANCAIWPHGKDAVGGIRNAFLEGRGMAGPLVTLIAINNDSKHTSVDEPHESLKKVGTIERDSVRIVSGEITKKELEFIILRIQKDFFPPENMTAEEKSGNGKQIFRGIIFK